MKKLFFIALVSLFAFGATQAQVIETGDNAVNIGLGFGGSMVTGDGLPSISASYEMLPFEKMGIGYLGLGGYVAYKHSSFDYIYSDVSYNYFVFGARGIYHFDFYSMNNSEFFNHFDVYAGAFLGFSYDAINYDGQHSELIEIENSLSFRNDIFIGCRYKFTESIGVHAEAGYGVSNLTAGISFLF